ncbi:MAG: 4-alpha-glucanotransferase, partial [Candidatus Neomarinimicrobiota bacterium]
MSERLAGVLMHPASLPSCFGNGDFGPEAYRFVDWLEAAGQSLWQILPLNYPDGTGSPYTSFSANAISEAFISPELLCREGLVDALNCSALLCPGRNPADRVREKALALACDPERNPGKETEFREFCAEHAYWLQDTALFMSIREQYPGSWYDFPKALRNRETAAIRDWERKHGAAIRDFKYRQFLLFRQWKALKRYANEKGIRIIGDIPIFISGDSADVWAHRDLFKLDADGFPRVWTGVPPDLFTKTGQLWAQPHYDWPAMKKEDYRWWVERTRVAMQLADIIRIDHFRGFCAAYEVPYGAATAEKGEWVEGPREAIFSILHRELPALNIIAEDLGVITPDVDALRKKLRYPGMKILQFAFNSDAANPYLPENFDPEDRFVVYTGTHDNDTTRGWYEKAGENEKAMLRCYLGPSYGCVSMELIKMAYHSAAMWAIIPLQDILDLDSAARMNIPGTTENNWRWQLPDFNLPE